MSRTKSDSDKKAIMTNMWASYIHFNSIKISCKGLIQVLSSAYGCKQINKAQADKWLSKRDRFDVRCSIFKDLRFEWSKGTEVTKMAERLTVQFSHIHIFYSLARTVSLRELSTSTHGRSFKTWSKCRIELENRPVIE